MVSHALGINLEGNGNEILLTREGGREGDREREGGRWVCGSFRNLLGKSAFSGKKLGAAEAVSGAALCEFVDQAKEGGALKRLACNSFSTRKFQPDFLMNC